MDMSWMNTRVLVAVKDAREAAMLEAGIRSSGCGFELLKAGQAEKSGSLRQLLSGEPDYVFISDDWELAAEAPGAAAGASGNAAARSGLSGAAAGAQTIAAGAPGSKLPGAAIGAQDIAVGAQTALIGAHTSTPCASSLASGNAAPESGLRGASDATSEFDIVGACRELLPRAQVVLVGAADFQNAYRAIKRGAAGYLPSPLRHGEIAACLAKIAGERDGGCAQRRFFFDDKNLLDALKRQKISLGEFNRLYGTRFCDGLFQMLLIKLDAAAAAAPLDAQGGLALASRMGASAVACFQGMCSDCIMEEKNDGILLLLNYPKARRKAVAAMLEGGLYERLKKHRAGELLTICASATAETPYCLWELKEQLRDVEWARMYHGVNRTILWRYDMAALSHEQKKELSERLAEFRVAFETLDKGKLLCLLDEFFRLPPETLASHEARVLIRQALALPFEIYADTIEKFANPAELHLDIRYALRRCIAFPAYKERLAQSCAELLGRISKLFDDKYTPAITQAVRYLKQNMHRRLSLEDVAIAVHLNKSYLSHLFHKETGQNFAKYVNMLKNGCACELLSNTDLNISEIADRVGYPSVQSFSKFFKGSNEITPSQYRRIYQAGSGQ